MTPEQRLAHLRDADAWTIAPLKPRVSVTPRREQSFFIQLAAVVVTGAVLGGLAVAGISALGRSQEGPPTVPASPTATQTPTPTPKATELSHGAWSSPPVQAFGGDCNAVASTAQMADFMGVSDVALLAPQPDAAVDPYSVVVEHNGGLTCQWAHDVDGDQFFVDVDIMPIAAFPDLDARRACGDVVSCGFADVVGDFAIMGTVRYFGLDGTPATKTDAVAAGLRARLSKSSFADVPPVWSQGLGDWDPQYSCDDFAEFVDAPHYGGSSLFPLLGKKGAAFGGIRQGLGATSCVVGDYMNGANVEVLAAGAWVEDRVKALDGVTTVVVQGADHAYRWTRTDQEGGIEYLFTFAGSNMLVVSQTMGMDKDLLPGTAVAALAYLKN